MKPKRTLSVIWFALLSSQFIYLWAVWKLIAKGTSFGLSLPDPHRPLEIMITLMAFSTLILGFAVYVGLSGKTASTGALVRWALLEAFCIDGFVLAFITKNPGKFLPFFAVSVLGFLATFPRSTDRIPTPPEFKE